MERRKGDQPQEKGEMEGELDFLFVLLLRCMDLTNSFLEPSRKGSAHDMSNHSRTLTDQVMAHQQDVCKKSRGSLLVV